MPKNIPMASKAIVTNANTINVIRTICGMWFPVRSIAPEKMHVEQNPTIQLAHKTMGMTVKNNFMPII